MSFVIWKVRFEQFHPSAAPHPTILQRLVTCERDCEIALQQHLQAAMSYEHEDKAPRLEGALSDKQITCKSGYQPGQLRIA